jgi:Raf kinase inhibitor-like YbhB/YbcL family protein
VRRGATLLAVLAATAFTLRPPSVTARAAGAAGPPFTISSPDFRPGGPLAVRNEWNGGMGCDGGNVAPRLTWREVPAGTRSFALTVVDPDAKVPGGFVHWVVYNIPGTWRFMFGNAPRGTTGGTSGFGARSYNGPCPPVGDRPHHYHFTLYALDVATLGGPGLMRAALLRAIRGHILGVTEVVGTFQRR